MSPAKWRRAGMSSLTIPVLIRFSVSNLRGLSIAKWRERRKPFRKPPGRDAALVPRSLRCTCWFGVGQAQQLLRLRGVMWTVIGRDWQWPAARVSRLVLNRAANGGIICLHDGRTVQPAPDISATIEAVEYTIRASRNADSNS